LKRINLILIFVFLVLCIYNPIFIYGEEIIKSPEWVSILRPECRPPVTKIERLESLRKKYNISQDYFALIILGHPATTKQLQKHLLAEARAKMSNVEERELWKMLLVSRLTNYVAMGFESPEILKEIDGVIKNAKNFDDVCNYIIKLDAKGPIVPITPDPFGIKRKTIDTILEE